MSIALTASFLTFDFFKVFSPFLYPKEQGSSLAEENILHSDKKLPHRIRPCGKKSSRI